MRFVGPAPGFANPPDAARRTPAHMPATPGRSLAPIHSGSAEIFGSISST
jgi:hypothetical protein